MKISLRYLTILFIILSLTACSGFQIAGVNVTPQRGYYEAQNAFFNAWESYHKVWVALPDTDARKAEWVKQYHPYFLTAAEHLKTWSQMPSDPSQGAIVNVALDELENILIQLAIKKGVK